MNSSKTVIDLSTEHPRNALYLQYFKSEVMPYQTGAMFNRGYGHFINEDEKLESVNHFIHELAEAGEKVYCLYYPRSVPVTNHENIYYIDVQSLTACAVFDRHVVVLVYDFDKMCKESFTNGSYGNMLLSSLHPKFVMYIA